MDYIVWWIGTDQVQIGLKPEEALEDNHVAKKIGSLTDPQLQKIVDFVRNNLNEIIYDCKEWRSKRIMAHQNPTICLKTDR